MAEHPKHHYDMDEGDGSIYRHDNNEILAIALGSIDGHEDLNENHMSEARELVRRANCFNELLNALHLAYPRLHNMLISAEQRNQIMEAMQKAEQI